jgi:hypothetical protein
MDLVKRETMTTDRLSRAREQPSRDEIDLELDRELEATFPASDPLKITRRKPQKTAMPKRKSARPKPQT